MTKYYYHKNNRKPFKKKIRLIGLVLVLIGISITVYVLFPLISWQLYFSPFFASQNITSSIPRSDIVELARNSLDHTDYTRAENWFPSFNPDSDNNTTVIYNISIPKIGINNAEVSTNDTDLAKYLVNYPGTGIPGQNGNAVIFGHSTLPQLYNPKDYKTIFANVYKLKNGDSIYTKVDKVTYSYKVFNTIVVDADDTSALAQNYDDSYLTLVTCTPPGTIWKRLVIKAKLESI
jgi:sortase A